MKVARWYRVQGLRIVSLALQGEAMTLVDAMEAGAELASSVAERTALVTSGERGSGRRSRR